MTAFVVAFAFGMLLPLGAQAQTRAPERLQALGELLQSSSAWRAEYRQVYVPAGMTTGEQADGVVWVAWPDHALFVESDPAVRLMGLEGRMVRLVDLEVPSCDEHVLDDEEWARIPLAAVLDPSAAMDHFTLMDGEDGLVALVPREAGGIARVELEFDSQGMPSQVRVHDPQGAVNRLGFSGWQAVEGPPDGVWLPVAPEGLECEGDGDSPADPG